MYSCSLLINEPTERCIIVEENIHLSNKGYLIPNHNVLQPEEL